MAFPRVSGRLLVLLGIWDHSRGHSCLGGLFTTGTWIDKDDVVVFAGGLTVSDFNVFTQTVVAASAVDNKAGLAFVRDERSTSLATLCVSLAKEEVKRH
ncbi:MAG: hypothetical protein LUO93_10485 [Methanomicrobiales archaeon]|nr:hypothetical protein [Methanomicrobiales archaeon]